MRLLRAKSHSPGALTSGTMTRLVARFGAPSVGALKRSPARGHAPLSQPGSAAVQNGHRKQHVPRNGPLPRNFAQGKVLFMDGVAGGVAGDMILAAFVDLGVPVSVIQEAIDALNLGPETPRIETYSAEKSGVTAVGVEVELPDESLRNRYRDYRQIKKLIQDSALHSSHDQSGGLSTTTADSALRAFEYLAIAEASCHDMPVDDVHFHEVGALDSIADIVGAAACADYLGASAVIGSPLPMGRGIIHGAAHGPLPNPAPATLGIICNAGIPTFGCDEDRELVTPSGAAIFAALCSSHGYQRWPAITPVQYGFGAGTQTFLSRPNLLRIVIGAATTSSLTNKPHTNRHGYGSTRPSSSVIIESGSSSDTIEAGAIVESGRSAIDNEKIEKHSHVHHDASHSHGEDAHHHHHDHHHDAHSHSHE